MTEFSGKGQMANLIIAGVNKAGSTSLFRYLSSHPEICGSKDKETCYFLPLLYNEPVSSLSSYEEQFTHCSVSKYRMEATPAYVFGGEKIASEIIRTLGMVKVIIILKNPVDRLTSFFQRKKTTFQLPDEMTLSEYVNRCLQYSHEQLERKENQVYTGISLGTYHEYLNPWLQLFGNQIKIVFFDDLKKDTRKFMKEVCNWLEIDNLFYDNFEFDVKNRSFNYRNRLIHRFAVNANNVGQRFWRTNPIIKKSVLEVYYKLNGTSFENEDNDEKVIQMLNDYFQPHNKQLQSLLSTYGISNLPAWLSQVNKTA